MAEQRFKVTISFTADDLTRENGEDKGNSAVLVSNEVSMETRQLMEAGLMDMLKQWGAFYVEQKKSGTPSVPGNRPGK